MASKRLFSGATSLALILSAPVGAQDAPPPVPAIVTVSETIASAQRDASGTIVGLWNPSVRYVAAPQNDAGDRRLHAVLKRAADMGRAAELRFDGTHGRVNRGAETVDFPLCRAAIDDLVFEPEPRCAPTAPPPAPTGDDALALGLAALTASNLPRALQLLDRVDRSDDAVVQSLLLRARADAEASLAADAEPASNSADRLNIKALQDYRALVMLAPADMDAQISLGTVLEELGAYPEARAHFEQLLALHPEELYRLRVRIGAVYRREGDLKRALDQLDQVAAAEGGNPTGMKYHYHRGWTLNRLGRFDEAIADFTQGIATQPDYSWAYVHRACAYASVGQLKEALGDSERAATLMAALPAASSFHSTQFDLARTRAGIAELRQAIARGDTARRPGLCVGYWGHPDEARQRSPLLPVS